MSTPIEAVGALGVSPLGSLSFEQPGAAPGVGAALSAQPFAGTLSAAVENLQQLQSSSNELAVQAVTGDLDDIHKAMLASSRAGVTLELMVAVRDRGVAAFNDVMRMQA